MVIHKLFNPGKLISSACLLACAQYGYAGEYLIESSIDSRTEYNSNIFLTNQSHNDVYGLVTTPSISGVMRDQNWSGELNASLRNYQYSDHSLDSTDKLFNVTGRYSAERNIFTLNGNYDFTSNLNSTASNFGVVGRRINREDQSISPQYTRLLTERLVLTLGYTYSDVAYTNAQNTGFTDYTSNTGSSTLLYDLTERDKLTFSFFAVDYASNGTSNRGSIKYKLFVSRIGLDHQFSETLSADILVGTSRRNTTNKQTVTFDFFGDPVTRKLKSNSKSKGAVYDAGLTKKFESSVLEGRASRSDDTDSFGGLNQTDKFTLHYNAKLSPLWRSDVGARYEDITSIDSGTNRTNRQILFLETKLFYTITEKWVANVSYRYVEREFTGNNRNNSTVDSNRVYAGITYNFPSLSTF